MRNENENQNQNEFQEDRPVKRRRGFKGVVIAAVCIVAVGGMLIALGGDMSFRNEVPMDDQLPPVGDAYPRDDLDLDVLQPIPTTDSKENKPAPAKPSPAEKEISQAPVSKEPTEGVFHRPLLGTVTNDFSMTAPIYSKTLDQYMVHSGVDIEAEEDSQVKAVAPGTVTAVYEDDKLGMTIQLTHDNGLMTQYSNLSTGTLVEVGDVVERGQVIGGVGRTALFESLEPAHLHFEVLKGGEPLDPNEYVNF